MAKTYKNYIIWRGSDNPRLIDIVLSEYNPYNETFPSAAGTWWETIRQYYGVLLGYDQEWHSMVVCGKEDFIEEMQNCGAIP